MSAAISPSARIALAIALAWVGGMGSLALAGPGRLVVALGLLAALAWLRTHIDDAGTPTRAAGLARALALALLLTVLARALGRTLIEIPAALWSLPLVAAALWPKPPGRGSISLVLAGLALLACLAGARFEARGVQARGAIVSGPVIGVHPRQAVAIEIDGFGPHDLVLDDYVDPPGGSGYDPKAWADWLARELHAIAWRHYADGPARAHEAFARAEVELVDALVPPQELGAYESLLGIEVRSGTSGEGSRVRFVCPGEAGGGLDSGSSRERGRSSHACPRKYLVDGSTGLGLSSRFAGYTEIRGRDRARLGRALGWPHGDAREDRRALALESGLLLLGLLALALVGRRRSIDVAGSASVTIVAALGLALALIVALLSPPTGLDGHAIGPTLLALVLLALGPGPAAPGRISSAWVIGGLIALLAASPLAGRGDALSLLEAITDTLVLHGDLSWSSARALAGGAAVLVLGAGLAAGVEALGLGNRPADREPRHELARGWPVIALVLLLGLVMALRKPSDDLSLLHGAGAVLIASTLRPSARPVGLALGLVCALVAILPLVHGLWTHAGIGPVGWGAAFVAAALCLVLPLARARPAPESAG